MNLANYLDQRFLPGRKWDGTYDPEGLLSTLPAFVTGLLGIFAGLFLRDPSVPERKKALALMAAGAAGVALGLLWGLEFPVIKKIWTSSYVLVAGGYSAMLLGIFYWIVEVRKKTGWCQPFVWIGMNPITLYMVSDLTGGFPRLAGRLAGGSLGNFLDAHVTVGCGDLVVSFVGVLLFVGLARFPFISGRFSSGFRDKAENGNFVAPPTSVPGEREFPRKMIPSHLLRRGLLFGTLWLMPSLFAGPSLANPGHGRSDRAGEAGGPSFAG